MSVFPPSFLDQIRRRISVSDVIGRYVKIERKGANILACCPFHKEKTPSFYIYDADGHYHCYGCKAHGDIFTFLMEKRGFSFPEAVEDLANQVGIPMPRDQQETPQDRHFREKRELYYEIMEKAAQFFRSHLLSNEGVVAQKYTQKRGLTPNISEQFRLGYAPRGNGLLKWMQQQGYETKDLVELGLVKASTRTSGEFYDYFRDRLQFPICDQKGRVIAFGGRILGEGEPKYLNSPETPLFHKSEIVYGYHQALKHKGKESSFVLVEGYMDVIALHQAGFSGAVAPLGTSITEAQLRLLWRRDKEPIICLDGDAAGQKAAIRSLEIALPLIRANQSLRFVTLPPGTDPDSYVHSQSNEAFSHLLSSAEPLVDKLWSYCVRTGQFSTPEEKTRFRKQVYGYLDTIQDVSLKKSYEIEFTERLRQHFRSLKPKTNAATQGGARSFVAAKSPVNQHALTAVLNIPDIQFKILLAALINYPALALDFEDKVMELESNDSRLNELKDEILSYGFSHDASHNMSHESTDNFSKNSTHKDSNEKSEAIVKKSLENSDLNHHLCSIGFKNEVESVCNWSIYAHARFAQPNQDLEAVKESWLRIWHFCHGKSALEQDIKILQNEIETNPTIDNFQKLKRLQNELLLLKT